MSSFPKHSFEQAYDHAFPSKPSTSSYPRHHGSFLSSPSNHYRPANTTSTSPSERSPLISKSPLKPPASASSPTHYNTTSYDDSAFRPLRPPPAYTSLDDPTNTTALDQQQYHQRSPRSSSTETLFGDNNTSDGVRLEDGRGATAAAAAAAAGGGAMTMMAGAQSDTDRSNNNNNNNSSSHLVQHAGNENLIPGYPSRTDSHAYGNGQEGRRRGGGYDDDGDGGEGGGGVDGDGCGGSTSSSSTSGKYLSIKALTAREFKILLRYSGPVVLTYVLQNSLQLASLVSLGHLGPLELAASSLASMFAAVTCWSVSLGTATALDTLCSQSYTSHHPHTLGLHLQRAILILMLLFIPIAGIWLSSEQIFGLLGQDESLSQLAALFLKGLLPGAPAFLIFECVKKFLQAQGNMHASTYVLVITAPINVVLNYVLVWNSVIGMGFIGAPLATSISYWNMLILLLLYIRFVDGYQGWGGWSWECLTRWPEFLKLALPGVMMVCTEWWAFEVMSLAASYLGTVALAAQSVVVQTSGLLYTIPFGISIAASNRVGNLIGMGDARSAKVAARVSIGLSIMFGMVNSLMLIVFKERWGRLFSEDVEVVRTVAMVLPLVALFQISDGLAGVGGGVLRGVGLQHLGAYLNLIAYYLVAFPVGYLLAFKLQWGLKGLWSALCVALWLVGLGELWVIFKTNWAAEVSKCKIRNDLLAKQNQETEVVRGLLDADDDDDERSLVDHRT